jgi:signal recognition particle receptor subunit beta
VAVIDPIVDALVIRVVYDGPPLAGKTTSLRTLAGKLGGEVHTPEEIGGRTLYFDWLDYTGGLFEGRRIRCQIVSVPGQGTLASRRRRLIETADAIVFVGDTTQTALEQTTAYLRALYHVLGGLDAPPVGVVVQANKRDQPGAVPLPRLHEVFNSERQRAAIVESIATDGTGIREAFVFAVRLALDRVRELMRLGRLEKAPPQIDSADDLLAQLRTAEGDALALAAASGLQHTRLDELEPKSVVEEALTEALQLDAVEAAATTVLPREYSPRAAPLLPTGALPSGMIWPPVEGRIILHGLGAQYFTIQQEAGGDWHSDTHDHWMIQSPAEACFYDLHAGRTALLNWARVHSACAPLLSPRRCIALAEDGQGRYRLWQCVAIEPTLRSQFYAAWNTGLAAVTDTLIDMVDALMLAAREWNGAGAKLPMRLSTVSWTSAGPIYSGLMPYVAEPEVTAATDLSRVISTELRPLHPELRKLRADILQLLASRLKSRLPAFSVEARPVLERFLLAL